MGCLGADEIQSLNSIFYASFIASGNIYLCHLAKSTKALKAAVAFHTLCTVCTTVNHLIEQAPRMLNGYKGHEHFLCMTAVHYSLLSLHKYRLNGYWENVFCRFNHLHWGMLETQLQEIPPVDR